MGINLKRADLHRIHLFLVRVHLSHRHPASAGTHTYPLNRPILASIMSATNLESIGDIVVWVDTKLTTREIVGPQPVSSRLTESRPFVTMGSFVEGSHNSPLGNLKTAATINTPERERLEMRSAELEQCEEDDFWGLVANQTAQAEATAEMEAEDCRSQAVRARIEREKTCALWEEEDLRIRQTRNVAREKLEDAARRGYLEVRLYCGLLWSYCTVGLFPTYCSSPTVQMVVLSK